MELPGGDGVQIHTNPLAEQEHGSEGSTHNPGSLGSDHDNSEHDSMPPLELQPHVQATLAAQAQALADAQAEVTAMAAVAAQAKAEAKAAISAAATAKAAAATAAAAAAAAATAASSSAAPNLAAPGSAAQGSPGPISAANPWDDPKFAKKLQQVNVSVRFSGQSDLQQPLQWKRWIAGLEHQLKSRGITDPQQQFLGFGEALQGSPADYFHNEVKNANCNAYV